MDADAALCAMKQATQRLDEILQLMCAAAEDSEDAFTDAHEHVIDHATSSSSHANDNISGSQQQQQRAEYASAKEYFNVRSLLWTRFSDCGT